MEITKTDGNDGDENGGEKMKREINESVELVSKGGRGMQIVDFAICTRYQTVEFTSTHKSISLSLPLLSHFFSFKCGLNFFPIIAFTLLPRLKTVCSETKLPIFHLSFASLSFSLSLSPSPLAFFVSLSLSLPVFRSLFGIN